MFWMIEIPSGNVKFAKKIGPWSFTGGGQWSIAVDQEKHDLYCNLNCRQCYYSIKSII